MSGHRLWPRGVALDAALRRYLKAVRAEIEPDPLFRRRLRGTVLNRFVARREGNPTTPRLEASRSMGALGRATLMASVALALSVGGVMAAAQSALPGDPLYPVKRQIEAVRLEIAPDQYREALEAHMLAERLSELARLVAQSDMARAASLADAILNEPDNVAGSERRRAILASLVERLPAGAQEAIVRSIERSESHLPDRNDGQHPAAPSTTKGGGGPKGPTEGDEEVRSTPTPEPHSSRNADADSSTPSPKVSPRPGHSPRAETTPTSPPRGAKSR